MAVRANDAWKLSYPSHRAIQNRNNQTSSPRHTAEQCLKTKFNLPVIYFSFSELGIELTRLPPWSTNALCVFVEMHSAPPAPHLLSPSSVVCFPDGLSIFVCFLPPLLFWRSPSALSLSLTHPASLAPSLITHDELHLSLVYLHSLLDVLKPVFLHVHFFVSLFSRVTMAVLPCVCLLFPWCPSFLFLFLFFLFLLQLFFFSFFLFLRKGGCCPASLEKISLFSVIFCIRVSWYHWQSDMLGANSIFFHVLFCNSLSTSLWNVLKKTSHLDKYINVFFIKFRNEVFWGKRNVLGPIIMWKCLDWFCLPPREAISAVVCSLASSSDETVSTATAFPLSPLQQLHHSCYFFFFLWDFIWRTTSVASSFWLKLKGRWRTEPFMTD